MYIEVYIDRYLNSPTNNRGQINQPGNPKKKVKLSFFNFSFVIIAVQGSKRDSYIKRENKSRYIKFNTEIRKEAGLFIILYSFCFIQINFDPLTYPLLFIQY